MLSDCRQYSQVRVFLQDIRRRVGSTWQCCCAQRCLEEPFITQVCSALQGQLKSGLAECGQSTSVGGFKLTLWSLDRGHSQALSLPFGLSTLWTVPLDILLHFFEGNRTPWFGHCSKRLWQVSALAPDGGIAAFRRRCAELGHVRLPGVRCECQWCGKAAHLCARPGRAW